MSVLGTVPPPGAKGRRRNPAVVNLLESYAGRWSFRALARRLGVSPRTVQTMCWENGIRATENHPDWTPNQLAAELGISGTVVRRWCRSGRIAARPNPSWRHPDARVERDYRDRPRFHWLIPDAEARRILQEQQWPR